MASSSGTSSAGSLGSDQPALQQQVNQKKQKRMLSNRESAKRSRQRKQNHLDELAAQVARLKKENNQMVTSLNVTTHHYLNVESDNSVLRAQMGELSNRLHSLNDIINYMNPITIGIETQNFPENNADQGFMNQWNSVYLTQPIVGSTEMFEY